MAEKKSLLNKVIDAVTDRDEKAAAAAAAAAKAKAQAQLNANARTKAAVERAKASKIAIEKMAAAALKKHTVVAGETWTHLALKYYGRSIEPFWRLIYEYPANKALVGGDYHKLRPGMEIVIPELTEELKNMKIVKGG